ncbi:hypothetical protein JY06_11465 [Neisseria meningitidis]|uniref:Uncharacterized protein n=1 Tax=Neisseria meningitidis TaxID=487 RepID=A0A425B3U9_NEIME|nr:hypothetical protein AT729_00744 [Neisseria meningitidis]RPB68869.1 hypothetical protein JY06_11465 [Neisseria meningitidis]RPB80300.1 hypothetical protein JY13_08280 [Neisseria meningitidis]RPB98556.1 hypothetical protein JY21_06620 [Neisseria meningitidis]RPC41504.1 hypothetical protein JY47_08455 [Neisseria meningitidis]
MFLTVTSLVVLIAIALICLWVVCNNKKFEFRTIEILILVLIGTVAFSAFLILLRLESILIYLKAIQEFGVGK